MTRIGRIAPLFVWAAASVWPSQKALADQAFQRPGRVVLQQPAVGDDELSEMRGGFFTAEGAQFDFGANVQTLINGQLALETTLNWTSTGASIQHGFGQGGLGTVPAIVSDGVLATSAGTGGGAQQGIPIVTGMAASSPTVTFANIAGGQIQNILINRADNQTISQNTNIVFTIYNFAAWQEQLAQNAVSNQVLNEVRAAAGLGGSR
jgi:hypothetical protein